MIFKLHYIFLTSGACALTILLGVFMEFYTDASSLEIGILLMMMPFTSIICRPIICSKADRMQAHQKFMIICLMVVVISYSPFIIIPILGPDIYENHPRICFYVLSVMKIIGDIGFGGMISIGDALAINYCERIGAKYGSYRIWGALSWMSFGLIIGQVNEVSFLPKYVPGFMILLTASILNMLIIWLWPADYFVMVAKKMRDTETTGEKTNSKQKKVKCLLPKEVVLRHMKNKLLSVICLNKGANLDAAMKGSPSITVNGLSMTQKSPPETISQDAKLNEDQQQVNEDEQAKVQVIGMRVQMKALALLLRRDLRIVLYILYFIAAGSGMAPISFFFIGLSSICRQEGTCDFSQLAGMLQVSMSCIETVLLFYVKDLEQIFGRLNLCAFSLFCITFKWTFYSTIWFNINPYWALLIETLHGISFGICLTMMVELAHLFACEVEYIIPELIEKGVVKEGREAERLKLSLSATMQAIVSSATDGVGRGFGALTYGFLLERYSFRTFMGIISFYVLSCFIIITLVAIFDRIFKPELGFKPEQKGESQTKKNLDLESKVAQTKQDFREVDLS